MSSAVACRSAPVWARTARAPTASDDPNDGNVLISAAGNVDLESVQATSDSKSSSKAGGVSIGVAAGIDAGGNILGGGPTASASYSSGKENGSFGHSGQFEC